MPRRRHLASRSPIVRALSPLRDFLHTEAAGGALLVAATIAALAWANSPWRASYRSFWSTEISISVADHALRLDLRHWVADGLMAIFFLVVGLEIKRELTTGHLATRRAAMLPIAAAVGGMAVPALLYLAIAGRTDARGWGVPMATDIALAVGVLALLRSRVPSSGRAFLLGLAIVDDIGAIIVIALVYSSGVSLPWLVAAVVLVACVVGLQRAGVHQHLPFVLIGVVLWSFLHESGVHATLAGVAMGLLAPSSPRLNPDVIDVEQLTDLSGPQQARETSAVARSSVSTVEWLQHVLHPWTSYAILPAFALASAGVEISSSSMDGALRSWVAWGVFVGLVAGKPIGVLLAARVASRTGIASLPPGTSARQLLGIGHAAGIGFTVALFIADLAFDDIEQQQSVKLAILVASLVSAVLAIVVLRRGREQQPTPV